MEVYADVFHIAKLMANVEEDVMNVNCLRNKNGKVIVDSEGINAFYKDYMDKVLNEEHILDQNVDSYAKGQHVSQLRKRL